MILCVKVQGPKRARKLTALIAVSSVLMVAGPAAASRRAPVGIAGFFNVMCDYSHSLMDDPIVYPGQPGVSHMHDFYGNTTTNAFSTNAGLVGGPTTCTDELDGSAYWAPQTMMNDVTVTPKLVQNYWLNTFTGSVETPPAGIELIAGDSHATGEQDINIVHYSCGSGANPPFFSPFSAKPYDCTSYVNAGEGDGVVETINFPPCWDGQLPAGNDTTHFAYQAAIGDPCPAGFTHQLPQLSVRIHTLLVDPLNSDGSIGLSLMSGPYYTIHADFMSGWNQTELAQEVTDCLNTHAECGVIRKGSTPTITQLSPSTGPVNGGQCTTVTGTNFQPGATVKFGSNAGTVDFPVGNGQVTADTPPGTGTVDVTVTNPDGTSVVDPSAYTYAGSIAAPSPSKGLTPAVTGFLAPEFDGVDLTSSGAVEHESWACPPGWSTTESLGGSIVSAPAIASMNAPQLQVFGRGTANDLMEVTRDATGQWGSWASLGGVLASAPGAVSWGSGRLDVFVRGTDAKVWHKSYSSGVWSTWGSLGGVLPAGAAPTVASMGTGLLEVFVRGTNNGVWEKDFNGSTWLGWANRGGITIQGDPAATSSTMTSMQVFARGTDNALWYRTYTSGTWSSWTKEGGTLTSSPAATAGRSTTNPTVTMVLALGSDNSLWQVRSTGGVWGNWSKVP
jgi:hypothetical protein